MTIQNVGQTPVESAPPPPPPDPIAPPPDAPAPDARAAGDPHAAAAAQNEWSSRGLGADVLRSRLEGSSFAAAPAMDAAPQAAAAPKVSNAQLAAEFGAAAKRNDYGKMAEVLARAPADALPGMEKAAGDKLEYLLTDIRAKAPPEAYRKAVDGLTTQIGDRPPGDKAREALARHFSIDMAGGGNAVSEYTDRYLKPPDVLAKDIHHRYMGNPPPPGSPDNRDQAVAALARVGAVQVQGMTLRPGDDALGALMRYGDPSSPSFTSNLKRFPPETVDRVGKPLLHQNAARAHLDKNDTESAEIADRTALALFQAGGPDGQEDGINHYVGKAADDAIKVGRDCLVLDRQLHGTRSRLAELNAVKDLNAQQGSKGPLTAKGKADLDADIKVQEDKIARLEGQKDKLAEQTMKRMEDPQFKAMLAKMPPEEQAIMLKPMIANIQATKHADAFFQKHVLTAANGQDSVLKSIFEAGDKGREFSVSVCEGFAQQFAKMEDGGAKFTDAMGKILRKSPAEMASLKDSIANMNSLTPGTDAYNKAAREVEEAAGGGVAAKKLGAAFAGVAVMMSLKTLADKPDLKNAMSLIKDGAGLTKEVAGILEASFKSNPALREYAKLAGGVGKVAGAAAGLITFGLGAADMLEACKNVDAGSAIGSYMEAAGGLMAAGGVVIPPLAVVGAVVGVGGFVVKKLFGDSDEVRAIKGWSQHNGYEFRN